MNGVCEYDEFVFPGKPMHTVTSLWHVITPVDLSYPLMPLLCFGICSRCALPCHILDEGPGTLSRLSRSSHEVLTKFSHRVLSHANCFPSVSDTHLHHRWPIHEPLHIKTRILSRPPKQPNGRINGRVSW